MAWRYDPRARRYRDDVNGQFLSRDRAIQFVNQSLRATGNATDELARLVAGNKLSPADWREQMRTEIKGEVIRQALLGQGGLERMNPEAWGSVGGSITEQYRYLDRKSDNFFDQVAAGELSEDEIARRSRMYVNSAREAYERGVRRRLRDSEYDEVKWNLSSGESCGDCIDLSLQDWMPIDSLSQYPGDGKTACKTNCGCGLRYRRSDTGNVFEEDESEGRVAAEG